MVKTQYKGTRTIWGEFRLLAAALLVLASTLTWSQAVKLPPGPEPTGSQHPEPTFHLRPMPLPDLYWHFLMYQNHLDRAAAAAEAEGKDGRWLRNFLQKILGFDDQQFTVVRESAQRLGPQLKNIRSQAKLIVQSERALYASHLADPEHPSPGFTQLKLLRQKREAAVADEIAIINASLDPQSSAKLKHFLKNEFSMSAHAHLGPARSFDLAKHPKQPLHPEVQQ
jgi:hypothetical protein